jgi:hypothetical protein
LGDRAILLGRLCLLLKGAFINVRDISFHCQPDAGKLKSFSDFL